jgi:hypothetical protein
MRFSTKQDLEMSIAEAFRILTDFDSWETAAMRRGADISRTDKMTKIGAGMAWAIKFSYRNKPRAFNVNLTALQGPAHLAFEGTSATIAGEGKLDLIELGPRRTRMHVVMEVTPRTLTSRLFLQSLRLARGRVDRKFDQRIAQMAGDIETRYREAQRV